MTMHCVWYWITCTAQLYYSHASASVIATRWILTNSPRCDGINLCCGVVRSEPSWRSWSIFILLLCLPSVFIWKRSSGIRPINTRAVSNHGALFLAPWSNTSRSLLYVVELSYFITWNLTVYNLTEEIVYCFCGNKTVHDCCCFELFYRLKLDFLGLLERYVIICFCFFMHGLYE